MSFFRITLSTSFSPLSVIDLLVLGVQQARLDAAVLQLDDADEVRLADDAVRVEDVDQQVLDVAGGAVEVRADLVALAVELVALGALVLEDQLAALERRRPSCSSPRILSIELGQLPGVSRNWPQTVSIWSLRCLSLKARMRRMVLSVRSVRATVFLPTAASRSFAHVLRPASRLTAS